MQKVLASDLHIECEFVSCCEIFICQLSICLCRDTTDRDTDAGQHVIHEYIVAVMFINSGAHQHSFVVGIFCDATRHPLERSAASVKLLCKFFRNADFLFKLFLTAAQDMSCGIVTTEWPGGGSGRCS